MELRKAYEIVIAHLLEIAEERGEISLEEIDKEKKAIELSNDERCTNSLVEAMEDFIEDYGSDVGIW